MARARQILLVKIVDTGDDAPPSMLNAVPLGTYRQVVELLADYNTAPDGSPEGMGVLYGPGMTIQLPMVGPDDNVSQVMVTMDEEDTAWPVLERMCRKLKWHMMDPGTGRMFGVS